MIGLQLFLYLGAFVVILYISIKSVEWRKLFGHRRGSRNTRNNHVDMATVKLTFAPSNLPTQIESGYPSSNTGNSLNSHQEELSKSITYWVGRSNTFDPLSRDDFVDFLTNLAEKAQEFQRDHRLDSCRILWMRYRQIYGKFHFKFDWSDTAKISELLETYLAESLRIYPQSTIQFSAVSRSRSRSLSHSPATFLPNSLSSSRSQATSILDSQSSSRSQATFIPDSQSSSRFQATFIPEFQYSTVPKISTNFTAVYSHLFQEMQEALEDHQFGEYRRRANLLKDFLRHEILGAISQANMEKQNEYGQLMVIHQMREDLIPFYEILHQTQLTLKNLRVWVEKDQYSLAYQQLPKLKSFHGSYQKLNDIYLNSGKNPMIKLLWEEFKTMNEDVTRISQDILQKSIDISAETTLAPEIRTYMENLDSEFAIWEKSRKDTTKKY